MLILLIAGCKTSDSYTLVDAIFRGDIESVDKLLQKGEDPNQMSSDGFVAKVCIVAIEAWSRSQYRK
jgi:hypothetical protein